MLIITNIISTLIVKAIDIGSDCLASNNYVPAACPNTYKPDLNCTANKFSNPDSKCCPNFCPQGEGSNATNITQLSSTYRKLVIFGTDYRFSPESTSGVIKLVIQTILGLVSLYALVRGVYLAGFKRTLVTTPDEIGKINKELTNMLIGFIICWGFILILQFVSNFLGLGSLTALSGTDNSGANVVVVK